MNAYDMIARYAQAVAWRLPYRMRADVTAELKALLTEELDAKAGPAAPDPAMARELLVAFGAPAEAAINYHMPEPVIDPRDSRLFGKLVMIFMTALFILTVGVSLSEPDANATTAAAIVEEAKALGLKILGAMLIVFWLVAFIRRRSPKRSWSPQALPPLRDSEAVNRSLNALAVAFWTAGLAVLAIGPAAVMIAVSDGAAPQPLREAFAYDNAFATERAPFLWTLLAAAIAVKAWQVILNRRGRAMRILEAALTLALSAALFRIVLAGDVFAAEPANQYMKLTMALTGGWGIVDAISSLSREWRARADQTPIDLAHSRGGSQRQKP